MKRFSEPIAELQNEVTKQSLSCRGTIPSWLSGTLIRNGPVKISINGQSNHHWFDGLSMLHAFSFCDGQVSYSNKFLRSDAFHIVFNKGSLDYVGFASDPCRSLFKHLFTFFFPSQGIQNANVNVAKWADDFVALTEIPLPVKFDPETLDTLGVFNYQDELPKNKCWESVHAHYDAEKKTTYNYLIKYGKTSFYTLYSFDNKTRHSLAEIPTSMPSYMHSFAMTENYLILTEYPFLITPLDLITKRQPFIKNFSWYPEKSTRFIVIDRHLGNIVGTYSTKPFFAFHHANAFEKEGEIVLDIVTYNDAHIITSENLYIDTDDFSVDQSKLERFSLSLKTGIISSETLFSQFAEFPRIYEKYDGKSYQYVYLTGHNEPARNKTELLHGESLFKVNTTNKEALRWFEKGCSAGEPVFVPTPDAKEEDEGVILSLVIDRNHSHSFLLILDSKNFQEIGRVYAPHLIPPGLHGQYFNKNSLGLTL